MLCNASSKMSGLNFDAISRCIPAHRCCDYSNWMAPHLTWLCIFHKTSFETVEN